MKSIFSLIALVCFIQLSFSLSDIPTITILQNGIIRNMSICMKSTKGKSKGKSGFTFYIWVSNEGFSNIYQFKMLLEEPSYAFATCSAEPRYATRSTMECYIDTGMFPLNGTKVLLQPSYRGDGNFELVN